MRTRSSRGRDEHQNLARNPNVKKLTPDYSCVIHINSIIHSPKKAQTRFQTRKSTNTKRKVRRVFPVHQAGTAPNTNLTSTVTFIPSASCKSLIGTPTLPTIQQQDSMLAFCGTWLYNHTMDTYKRSRRGTLGLHENASARGALTHIVPCCGEWTSRCRW